MKKQQSLTANALLNTTKTVLGIIFPLITYPYVSRVLGVENLGIYNFSYSFLSYFLLIAALGIATYAIREGVKYREDQAQIQLFVSEMFSINLLSTLIAYILLFTLLFGIPFMEPYRKVVLILSAEIVFVTIGVSWVCNIYEDFLAIAVRTIGFQIISLILVFLFVRTPDDLYKYAAILLVSNSGANIVNCYYIRSKYCKFSFTLCIDWNRHLKPILIIFSTTVAITIYVSADTTMLGFMTNDYQVGLYGTAVKIYTIIKNILAAVLMVLIPRFTLLFSGDDREYSNELFSRVFNILTTLMLPMCVGLFALSDDVVLIISGKAYMAAAEPLRLLCMAIIFSLYAFMYTQCVLIPTKKERIVFRATAISAIVNIGLNFVMIPLWGINAAAITTIIAELITFMIAYQYSCKTVSLVGVKSNFFSALFGCVLIYIICLFAKNIEGLWLRVFVAIFGSIGGYIMALVITRNSTLMLLNGIIRKDSSRIDKN